MLARKRIVVLLAAVVLAVPAVSNAGEIFGTHDHAEGRKPAKTYEEDRTIEGHKGESTTLSFRLSLYGEASENMPMLVQVHEWGGHYQRQEDLASYVPKQYSFVMLYFQYKPSTGNEDDWWFGTMWDGVCRMWAHKAVMKIVREAVNTSLVPDHLPGATIDKNRVYMFGHSIGGTGAWQLGVRNPDVFAAMHAHAGFARFTSPVGPFERQFADEITGRPDDNVQIKTDDGKSYPIRDYCSLAWWLTNCKGPAYETPFINITAGTADDVVLAVSGGDLMVPVLDKQKRGFFYHRHNGGHSEDCFVQMNWMWNFRLNQSFLAFTNRKGYGITPDATIPMGTPGGINDLTKFGWDPDSIVDEPNQYQVKLTGEGTADVTLRRLQKFKATPNGSYQYWLDKKDGPGTPLTADEHGLLTVPAVSGAHLLIVEAK